MYHVYKITNKINGKVYVGRTSNIARRFQVHKNYKEGKSISYIGRAIQKYGEDNFVFEIVESNENSEYINIAEYNYITVFNSIRPNGYNLRHEAKGKVTVHEESKEKLSKINQGKKTNKPNMSSKYTGVSISKYGEYVTSVRVNRKIVARRYETELLAAQAYDKLVLYLFGDTAKINFEEKRNEFLISGLDEFYNDFLKTYYTSKYNYVSCNANKTKWRVRLDVLQIPDKIKIDFITSQEEAAHIADKFIIHYKLNKKLNFPDYNYDLGDFPDQIKKWKERLVQTSSEKGVNRMKSGRWRSYYYVGKKQIVIGYFGSEEEAIDAKNNHLRSVQT